jgi:hypothetical protein
MTSYDRLQSSNMAGKCRASFFLIITNGENIVLFYCCICVYSTMLYINIFFDLTTLAFLPVVTFSVLVNLLQSRTVERRLDF